MHSELVTRAKVAAGCENGLTISRRLILHSSAACLGMDFTHSIMGKAMILARFWEHWHEVGVGWGGFAAVIIVYIDGHKERVREHCASCSADADPVLPDQAFAACDDRCVTPSTLEMAQPIPISANGLKG